MTNSPPPTPATNAGLPCNREMDVKIASEANSSTIAPRMRFFSSLLTESLHFSHMDFSFL